MQQEIECKFLNVDHQEVRKKLKKLGAVCEHPMRLMRRVVIDYPDRRMQVDGDSWVRVRDEGDKVTLTYKQAIEHEFGGAQEIEVGVSDYQKTIDIFLAMGLVVHTDQETRRETWKLDNVEVVLDEWPWIDPFIEIEGESEKSVKSVASRLGFDWKNVIFGTVVVAYAKQYPKVKDMGIKISQEPQIKFNLPKPTWFNGSVVI
jgi:adenylate cyclase, class 2